MNSCKSSSVKPEQQAYIDTMMRITQGQDWLAAIGVAGIAGEWPIPPYYTMLLKGLRTVPGLTDDDLQLFIEHIDLDVHHSHIVETAILPYLDSQIKRDSLWRGIELNLNARIVQCPGQGNSFLGHRHRTRKELRSDTHEGTTRPFQAIHPRRTLRRDQDRAGFAREDSLVVVR